MSDKKDILNIIDVLFNSSDYLIYYFIFIDLGISGVVILVCISVKDCDCM